MSNDKEKCINEYRDFMLKKDSEEEKLIKNLKNYLPLTVDDWSKSNSKICFVFSCPGNRELIENKVCAGNTGDNLNKLLNKLNAKCEVLFPSKDRYDYAILNASNHVNFMKLTSKSEENKKDIMSKDNLKRINDFFDENKNIKYVIFFGDNAELLKDHINDLKNDIVFAKTRHLGFQSLNQIKEDIEGHEITETGNNATESRLEVVAECIWKQMNK